MNTAIEIRDAQPSDAKTILHFINELAIYEKEPDAVKTDEQAILDTLFCDGATAHSLICLQDDEPIGFAVYFYNYSTWLGKNGLYFAKNELDLDNYLNNLVSLSKIENFHIEFDEDKIKREVKKILKT